MPVLCPSVARLSKVPYDSLIILLIIVLAFFYTCPTLKYIFLCVTKLYSVLAMTVLFCIFFYFNWKYMTQAEAYTSYFFLRHTGSLSHRHFVIELYTHISLFLCHFEWMRPVSSSDSRSDHRQMYSNDPVLWFKIV